MNGLRTWVLERGVMPALSSVTSSRFWDLYREMLRLEREPLERLREIQWRRLGEQLAHAHESVPLYRELFDGAGIRPAEIRSPEDLQRLPVLTKEAIQRGFPDRVTSTAIDRRDWRFMSTRGTTDRLVTVQDFGKRDMVRAAAMRALRLSGDYRLGRTMVEIPPDVCNVVCGDEGEADDGVAAHLWRLLTTGRWNDQRAVSDLRGLIERGWVLRKKTYHPFGPRGACLPDQDLDRYLERLRRDRPFLLKALPTYLFELAGRLRRRAAAPLDLGVVKPMGGSVSPEMRRRIEGSLGGSYREDYGSAEFGDMACDCGEREGLHLFMDLFLIEIVRGGRAVPAGELGKVLVTDLTNRAMPLVRYEIGDVGRLITAPCTCGRSSPRILLEGRAQDTLVTGRGEVFSPDRIMDFFYAREEIREFQLVEKVPGRLALTLVEVDGARLDDGRLAEELRELLGDDPQIRISRAATIKPESGGKFRLVKSASHRRLDEERELFDPAADPRERARA